MTWRVSRKKASVEAMLKTAMQSQLDGVRTGLYQLEKALLDISDIKSCMVDMEDALGGGVLGQAERGKGGEPEAQPACHC